jgi:hypothetical protein
MLFLDFIKTLLLILNVLKKLINFILSVPECIALRKESSVLIFRNCKSDPFR